MFAPLWNDIYGEHETNNDILIGALILEFFVLTLQIADAGHLVTRRHVTWKQNCVKKLNAESSSRYLWG